MPGDGGRRRERREKVKKGEKTRRRWRRDVELFSKRKELLVTKLRLLLPSLPLLSQRMKKMCCLSVFTCCVIE